MIYTITFNPAIDYTVYTKNIKLGYVNRNEYEEICCGGKGINVSIVLNELGIASKALGFIAGFTGKAIEEKVRETGVEPDFIHLNKGFSRINVKIKSDVETDLNGQGPEITLEAMDLLFKKLDKIKDGDVLILAGSIPKTLPNDIYEKILQRLSDRKIKTVIDAEKDLLINTLKYKPFLIKPNNYELEEIFGVTLNNTDDIIKYAKKLKEMGAINVLVSMADNGAMLIDANDNVHICGVCNGIVKNSVGAGDSMVAGFIAGIDNNDYDYALKLGTAAGGATAFSNGLAKKEEIYRLLKQLL